MEISLPIFQEQLMQYIPWNIKDKINLELHYNSLKIPKATKIDDNITRQLNKLYDLYDQQLSIDIDTANTKIDDIKEDNTTTLDEIIIYTIAAFTGFSTIASIILIIIECKRPPPNTCRHCHKPKKEDE